MSYFGINQIDLLRRMSKPNDKDKGVIFNIDLTGNINDSTTGEFAFFLNILIGTDVYSNTIKLYGCGDSASSSDCTDSAHYTVLIGTLELTYINQVKVASLEVRKTDSTLANVKLNNGSGVDIKFLTGDLTKLLVLIKACANADCSTTNDFFVGGIYTYLCKNIILINRS